MHDSQEVYVSHTDSHDDPADPGGQAAWPPLVCPVQGVTMITAVLPSCVISSFCVAFPFAAKFANHVNDIASLVVCGVS